VDSHSNTNEEGTSSGAATTSEEQISVLMVNKMGHFLHPSVGFVSSLSLDACRLRKSVKAGLTCVMGSMERNILEALVV
jgi:hypothetical protein